ncbi:hypothetical protein HYALB_00006683 [Hymenoscyphus albidus]|uniref:Uncharacterized protein n=1 Tax=Hymenoscyphus albidus TaxID=595503 RepID=A0A9N9LGD0_9HELO|nr:hypothetical protein HYALB_00006683 [Hymenoscyphus albidus]
MPDPELYFKPPPRRPKYMQQIYMRATASFVRAVRISLSGITSVLFSALISVGVNARVSVEEIEKEEEAVSTTVASFPPWGDSNDKELPMDFTIKVDTVVQS